MSTGGYLADFREMVEFKISKAFLEILFTDLSYAPKTGSLPTLKGAVHLIFLKNEI